MQNPGRYVPIHILEKAIRYGKRSPDPRGSAGYFMYEIKIYRLKYNKSSGSYYYKKFNLEVLAEEKTWTIAHFLYK